MTETPVLGPRPEPPPVLPILGVMSNDREHALNAASEFARDLGGLGLEGDRLRFDDTDYYVAEMGPGLERSFWILGTLLPASNLRALKLRAWEIEQRFLHDDRRSVNLDPGYIDFTKVVLASFKEGPQKLYLGGGVWADTILFFQHGEFHSLPWTFPDFRAGAHAQFFIDARQQYKKRLREWRLLGDQRSAT